MTGDPRHKLGVPAPTDPITGLPKRPAPQQLETDQQRAHREQQEMEVALAISDGTKRCRSCPAWIFFATTTSKTPGKGGKAMPMNLEPTTEGKRFTIRKVGGRLYATYTNEPGAYGYVSHYATCPNANEHRREDRKP